MKKKFFFLRNYSNETLCQQKYVGWILKSKFLQATSLRIVFYPLYKVRHSKQPILNLDGNWADDHCSLKSLCVALFRAWRIRFHQKLYFSRHHPICDRQYCFWKKYAKFFIFSSIEIYFWKIYFWKNVHKLHSARNFDEIFEISAFSAREQNVSRKISGYIFEKLFLEKCSQIALR